MRSRESHATNAYNQSEMNAAAAPPFDRRDLWFVLSLAGIVFLIHALSPNATPFDSRWTVHTSMSVLREFDTDLNEYEDLLAADQFYGIECVFSNGRRVFPVKRAEQCAGGRYYHWYPVAVPFVAAPAIAALRFALWAGQPVFDVLGPMIPSPALRTLFEGKLIEASAVVEILVASLIVALTAALFYLLSREFLDRAGAAAMTCILAFCTPAWSTASRALWQHGPSMLILTLALWIAVRAGKDPRLIRFLGAPLALGFFMRPTNAVAAVVFTVFVAVYYRRYLASFLMGVIPVALAFDVYNLNVYGTSLAPYSLPTRANADGLALHTRLGEALAGNLVSPARGLFVYVPIAVLAIYGALARSDDHRIRRLNPFVGAIFVLHWLLISTFETWWGGHGYGPRFMTDIVPAIVWFLIPVWQKAFAGVRVRRYGLAASGGVLVLASFWIHQQGATKWACYEWSTSPVELNDSLHRLWDWRDPAFLRGIRDGPPPG